MAPQLTIQLLGWNGEAHLEETARTLAQIPQDQAIIKYIDNASTDSSLSIIRNILPNTEIIQLETNTGFAGAHNLGFSQCTTPFVLTLDQDIVIIWEGLQKLIEELENNPKLGAVQGKLYRKDGEHIIDSAGIIQTLALNGKEVGSHTQDYGQYEEKADLLAVTGGCGLYRIEALRSVAYANVVAKTSGVTPLTPDVDVANEIFDVDFFAYKEDVDLGWRINNAGWGVQYIPVLVGYHARTLGKRGIFNWGLNPAIIRERLASPRTRWSLRNYIWMIAKNASTKQIILHWPFIKLRLFVFFVLSLFSRDLFAVWGEAWRGIPEMREKRLGKTQLKLKLETTRERNKILEDISGKLQTIINKLKGVS